MMRLRMKVSGSLLAVVVAVWGFANWKVSPLHLRVCGPDSSLNLRWIFYGRRANDNWPARLCGCEMPAAFAAAIRRGYDSNPGALLIQRDLGSKKDLAKYLERYGFGIDAFGRLK